MVHCGIGVSTTSLLVVELRPTALALSSIYEVVIVHVSSAEGLPAASRRIVGLIPQRVEANRSPLSVAGCQYATR